MRSAEVERRPNRSETKMNLEDTVKAIEAKLSVLSLSWRTSERSLQEKNKRDCEKHFEASERKVEEIRGLITSAQEEKLIAGEGVQEVDLWGVENHAKLQAFVEKFRALSEFVDGESKREEAESASQLEQTEIARLLEREKQLLEGRKQLHTQYEDALLQTTGSSGSGDGERKIRTKLPKINISKFDGDILDFLRFWSTFMTDIDASSLPETSKFSYLKELLSPKVRYLVDGLPFSADGYNRAKTILKQKFGQESEIISAHVSKIMSLKEVPSNNPVQIQQFYEKLVCHVQALETMDKLSSVNGYTRTILDRLSGIRADLVRDDEKWKEWTFPELVEALRKWTDRNPIDPNAKQPPRDLGRNPPGKGGRTKDHMLSTGQMERPPFDKKKCVFCNGDHKSQECTAVPTPVDRKKFLARNKLCFNCTGKQHQAAQCPSKGSCFRCKRRHHTSICDNPGEEAEAPPQQPFMLVKEETVIYPVIVVKINGVTCRAMLDTAAGSSYVSASLIDHLKLRNYTTRKKSIQMMFTTQESTVKIFSLDVCDNNGESVFRGVEMTKVDRENLLTIPNPQYEKVKKKYKHLRDISFGDTDLKPELPIHVILGISEYTQSKTATVPRIGKPGEPIAEHTKFGWVMMSPGRDEDVASMMCTQSCPAADFDQLSRLDVLGVEDLPEGSQKSVYDEFKEQLTRREDGHYETGLMWKVGHPPLPTNEHGSLKRLSGFLRKQQAKDPELLKDYDRLIRDQLEEGIVEKVDEEKEPVGKTFYLPHRAVVRHNAESTKIRQVCDASARENSSSPSVNDCLETGPSLQNLIWNIIMRTRFSPIVLCGDMKKAFLQIFIREAERDALRFHWIKSLDEPNEVEILRFTRALFGLNQSPFILGATLEVHLASCVGSYPKEQVEEVRQSLYVDDLILGLITTMEGEKLKEVATAIFRDAGFDLHKWHSNETALEDQREEDASEVTFAKEKFGNTRETKLLGYLWDKLRDTLGVNIPEAVTPETKRGVLMFLAAVYDPLGFVSPVILVGKCIFRDCCEAKIPWDKLLTGDLLKRWHSFLKSLPPSVIVKRALVDYREEITHVDLHVFGDASKLGTAAVAYAVVYQPSGISQGIVAAKARISKKKTIPRLELVAGVMAANLLHNVREVLGSIRGGVKIRKEVCWSDSSTTLHWIRGDQIKLKQFVRNHVGKILEKTSREIWRHVPGIENPADVASRGATAATLGDNWWRGPPWLSDEEKWPEDVQTVSTAETESEVRMLKEVLSTTVADANDPVSELVNRFEFKKFVRITGWILRFVSNASKQREVQHGPLTTKEIDAATRVWVKKVQSSFESDPTFLKHQNQFNLQRDSDGVYICVGRVQGFHPIYLPTQSKFTEALVRNAHLATLHGGVGLTLTKVRETYWIPRLRQLTKRIRTRCYGCKRMQVTALKAPKPADLPTERTVGVYPFQVLGLDFAGPIAYKKTAKTQGKAYIIIYSCSLTRAISLELLPDQTHASFVPSLKKLMARKGRPQKIYSDNFSTFVSAAKWLKGVVRNESVHDYLASNDIRWQFNLSRAPWWGGQFERMVGLVKQAMYKVVGNALLTREELEEVLLDVELCLNNRPLSYVEDDVDMPILTPNVMMFGERHQPPEEDADNVGDKEMRKRARYIQSCKDRLWTRWTNEYLRGLRERHDLTHQQNQNSIRVGDVMLVKGDQKNRAKWKIGIVSKLITGRDRVVRGATLRAGRDTIERAVQHLYPMELNCDRKPSHASGFELNPKANTFRPKRAAAVRSAELTKGMLEMEANDPDVEY